MTSPNWFGWFDTAYKMRNEKRLARHLAAEVGNDISEVEALVLATALDACDTDPDHILNAQTFWADADEQTALSYGDADLTFDEFCNSPEEQDYRAKRAAEWKAWKEQHPTASPYRFGTSMWDGGTNGN